MSAIDRSPVPPEMAVILEATATLKAIGALLDEAGIPDGDLLARVQALVGERDAARAEVSELRLTLAAEQGKPEGAPSEGWEYGVIDEEGGLGWAKDLPGNRRIFAHGSRRSQPDQIIPGAWSLCSCDDDGEVEAEIQYVLDGSWTNRAAMIAAEKAVASTPTAPTE